MSGRSRTLYVSIDGVLDPLGHSQVLRVIEALARSGTPYALLSLERSSRLADAARVREIAMRLEAAGIEWTAWPYDERGGAKAAAANVAKLFALTLGRVGRGDIGLMHARGYHAGAAAWAAKRAFRVPYLFDARGYWIEERREAGQWFTRPRVYAAAKVAEKRVYDGAAAIVTLTDLQREDVRRGQPAQLAARAVVTIPTCADFDQFRLREDLGGTDVPVPPDALVLGFVGSINASYRMDAAVTLAREVQRRRPDSYVLALGGDPSAYRRLFADAGLDQARTVVARVEHDRIQHWVPRIDWGLLLLATTPAKRASMPTKLGEFLAAGVRPVHHGCNTEVGQWVRDAGTGLSMDVLSNETIAAAIAQITENERDLKALRHGRAIAEPHFALAAGVERYRAIIERLARVA